MRGKLGLLAVLATLVLSVAGSAAAAVYRWVDSEGKLHYSDRPRPGRDDEALQFFDSDGGRGPKVEPAEKKTSTTAGRRQPTHAKQQITASDYRIQVRVDQQGELVTFAGRIAEGPPCKRLRLTFYAHSNDGLRATASTAVEDLGSFGSRLFETSDRVKAADTNFDRNWTVSEIAGLCN